MNMRNVRQGFSLIELLVVIVIIALLTSLLIPALRGVGGANQLTGASAQVVSELNLARQSALTESQEIEVRFYKLPSSSGIDPAYRAMQRFRVADQKALDKIVRLPNAIVMTDIPKFSTLLSADNGGATTTTNAQGVEYRTIRYHASGSTSLDPLGANGGLDRWFLTVATQNDLRNVNAGSPKPANNFITIQVDPVTGRSRVFQP